jgi:hypothetical protein
MSEEPDKKLSKPVAVNPHNAAVEEILLHLFPLKVFMDASDAFKSSYVRTYETSVRTDEGSSSPELKKRVQAERIELLALTPKILEQRLRSVRDEQERSGKTAAAERTAKQQAKAVAKEAAKFYNQPKANADFDYWSKAEFWTFDEAIALLLGKEPKLLTPAAVKGYLAAEAGTFLPLDNHETSSLFIRTYERLRSLAQRAAVMQTATLIPLNVIEWALRTGIVEPPQELVKRLSVVPSDRQDSLNELGAPPIEPGQGVSQECEIGDPEVTRRKPWTTQRFEELRAFKDKHGTEAAGRHFNISGARVRLLLAKAFPKSPRSGPATRSPWHP